jgi:hypothetical protein
MKSMKMCSAVMISRRRRFFLCTVGFCSRRVLPHSASHVAAASVRTPGRGRPKSEEERGEKGEAGEGGRRRGRDKERQGERESLRRNEYVSV